MEDGRDEIGTVKVVDVPVDDISSADLVPVAGQASLRGMGGVIPNNGRPAADYPFEFRLVFEDGSVGNFDVLLPFSASLADGGGLQNNNNPTNLIPDLNSALAKVPVNDGTLADLLSVNLTGGRFRFAAIDPSVVQVRISGGEGLGFNSTQTSTKSVVLAGSPASTPISAVPV